MKKSKNEENLKVMFIQPAYSKYRQMLFDKFEAYYNTTFFFIKEPKLYLQHKLDRVSLYKKQGIFLLHLIRRYLNLLFLLMKNNYSVIITSISCSPQTIISIIISKIKKYKCILWIAEWYDPLPETFMSKIRFFILTLFKSYILKNVTAIVVYSTASYNSIKKYDITFEKIFFSNNCSIDYSKYNSRNLKNNLNIPRQTLVILYLGRIIKRKGLDILMKAFKKIELESDDVFLLVCGDGDFRSFCEDLAKKLKIKNIKFVGTVWNVASYYKTSDIFIAPSCIRNGKCEPWGLVINEAMSMGKPVVTTDAVGAAPYLVKNGINGYIVKNRDVEEMYLALKKILEDDQLRTEMGKNSKKIFQEFNDFDKMFKGFKKAIEYTISKN